MRHISICILTLFTFLFACKEKEQVVVPPATFSMANVLINGSSAIQKQSGVNQNPGS